MIRNNLISFGYHFIMITLGAFLYILNDRLNNVSIHLLIFFMHILFIFSYILVGYFLLKPLKSNLQNMLSVSFIILGGTYMWSIFFFDSSYFHPERTGHSALDILGVWTFYEKYTYPFSEIALRTFYRGIKHTQLNDIFLLPLTFLPSMFFFIGILFNKKTCNPVL